MYEVVGEEPHSEAPGGPTIPPSRGWYQQSDGEWYEYEYYSSMMAPIEPARRPNHTSN